MENNYELLKKRAEEILGQCNDVVLCSVSHDEFPRPCVVAKVKTAGCSTIYMSTGTFGTKVAHFRENSKAGLCFYHGGDSVTMTGNVEIIDDMEMKKACWLDWFIDHFPLGVEDPTYCILKFTAEEATFYIDQIFETHKFTD